MGTERNQIPSMGDSARIQQNCVGHGEDSDIGADSERQGEDGYDGKSRRLCQLPYRVA